MIAGAGAGSCHNSEALKVYAQNENTPQETMTLVVPNNEHILN
jgi:hypothetical protein